MNWYALLFGMAFLYQKKSFYGWLQFGPMTELELISDGIYFLIMAIAFYPKVKAKEIA